MLRTIVELEEQTATGEALLAGLVRTQLRLAVGLMLLMAVSLGVLPLSLSLEGATMATADAREAAQAFREKREPKFTGS